MNSLEIAKIAAKAADSKKGVDIQVIGIRDLSILADYFVLVSGSSTTQLRHLQMRLNISLKKRGRSPIILMGKQSGWICLDFSSVVIHVFLEEQREYL